MHAEGTSGESCGLYDSRVEGASRSSERVSVFGLSDVFTNRRTREIKFVP